MRPSTRRKTLYLATAVALAALSTGYVVAAVITPTSTTQTSTWYQVTNGAVAAFPTQPSVQASATPTVTGCTSTAQALTNGGSAVLVLPASSSVTCATGDFAELFTFASSATAAAQNYQFLTYDSYGSGPTSGSASGTVSIATTLTSAGTVTVYVDFGSAVPPSAGISSLNIIVQ